MAVGGEGGGALLASGAVEMEEVTPSSRHRPRPCLGGARCGNHRNCSHGVGCCISASALRRVEKGVNSSVLLCGPFWPAFTAAGDLWARSAFAVTRSAPRPPRRCSPPLERPPFLSRRVDLGGHSLWAMMVYRAIVAADGRGDDGRLERRW